jgi:hypothetical protein
LVSVIPPPKVLVADPITARLVVVAVPLTMRFVVEALVVAVRVPIVPCPIVAEGAVRIPVSERFEAFILCAVIFPALTPRKVEVPEVAVKLKPVTKPKTSRKLFVVVFEAPMSTCAVVVAGR